MADVAQVFPSKPTGVFRNYRAVTPNDTTRFIPIAQALLVSVGGTLSVVDEAGNTQNLTVPAGYVFLSCKGVNSTGTAATGISRHW